MGFVDWCGVEGDGNGDNRVDLLYLKEVELLLC